METETKGPLPSAENPELSKVIPLRPLNAKCSRRFAIERAVDFISILYGDFFVLGRHH